MRRDIFSEEHEMFRAQVRRFVENELVPKIECWNRNGRSDRESWRKMGEAGFLGANAPAEYGGAGADFLYDAIVVEELSRVRAHGLMMGLHSDIIMPYIATYGTDDQKRRFLAPAISGETILAIAMTEPGTGSDLAAVQTTAVPAHKGVSLIIVEATSPGFMRGRKLDKLGLKGQDTSELFFEDCRVPVTNLLGREGSGFKMWMEKLQQERLVTAVGALTSARRCLDDTIEYTKGRRAFGQAISSLQNTQFKLAEMETEVEIGQAFVDRLLVAHVRGDEVVTEVSMAKWWTTELLKRVSSQCLQLHGGYGFMNEFPVATDYADAAVQSIYAGTNEIMKVIIARRMGLDPRN